MLNLPLNLPPPLPPVPLYRFVINFALDQTKMYYCVPYNCLYRYSLRLYIFSVYHSNIDTFCTNRILFQMVIRHQASIDAFSVISSHNSVHTNHSVYVLFVFLFLCVLINTCQCQCQCQYLLLLLIATQ